MEIAKYGHKVPVSQAPCERCAELVAYNLAAGILVHVEGAVDPCNKPWPQSRRRVEDADG